MSWWMRQPGLALRAWTWWPLQRLWWWLCGLDVLERVEDEPGGWYYGRHRWTGGTVGELLWRVPDGASYPVWRRTGKVTDAIDAVRL